MKKMLALLAAAGLGSMGAVTADAPTIASIDGIVLMQKSKEGAKVSAKIQKEIDAYQAFVESSKAELASMQKDISAKAEALSAEALQEKTEQLANKKKSLERTMADREEGLRATIQKEQLRLRDKQLAVAKKVFEEKKWGMLIDRQAPGVLFVADAIDKTSEILAKIDEAFDKENAAPAPAKKSAVKKEIKTA